MDCLRSSVIPWFHLFILICFAKKSIRNLFKDYSKVTTNRKNETNLFRSRRNDRNKRNVLFEDGACSSDAVNAPPYM